MKHLKSCTAAVLALLAADAAFAATNYIKITGSSAFRASTTVAAFNLLDSTKPITGGFVESGKGMTGATRTILKGKLAGDTTGDDYVIQMFWTGSVGGVLNLATNVATTGPYTPSIPATQAWVALPSGAATALTAVSKTGTGSAQALTGGATLASVSYEAASIADMAMSDSKQNTTPYDDSNFSNLNEIKVGVVPFVFLKGSSADATVNARVAAFTNINSNQAQQMLSAGGLPLSQFTGVATDSSYKVFPIGRDADSGTRVVTFAETGFGVASSPTQYAGTVTSGKISSIALYPAQSINGTNYAAGQGGYASGGNLVTPLVAPIASNAVTFGSPAKIVACLVGYVGTSDAKTALTTVGSGTSLLNYNGVGITFDGTNWDYTNVKNGAYTFWSYAYIMERVDHQFTDNPQDLFFNALATQITADAGVSGVKLSEMAVKRNSEGGKIF